MWIWLGTCNLINLSHCSRLSISADRRGKWLLQAHAPQGQHTLHEYEGEKEAREALGRIRAQLNRSSRS